MSEEGRPGAPTGVHSILRVSNVGGREIRFGKDGSVLIWDGSLMRFRAPDEKERSLILAWLSELTKWCETTNAQKM
jgi:hypothetical protein